MRAWPARASAQRASTPEQSMARSDALGDIAVRLLPPYREVKFWAIQSLVLAAAVVHGMIEALGLLPDLGALYFIPISLFFIPVVYAAVNFGFRGSVATALWCTMITVPDWTVWHSGLERWGTLFQMSVMVGIAAFVGNRVDKQMQARARAEEASRALEISELKYRGLFETAGEGVLVLDRSGRIIECNAAASALLRCPSGDLCNSSLSEIQPPHLASALLESVGVEGALGDVRLVGPDGRDVWVEPVCAPLAQGDGLTQVLLRNVTEQKRRQAGLQTYAAQILRVQEEERQRIAQELHDETVQSLILLCRKLDNVNGRDGGASSSAVEEIRQARAYTESVVESLRGFIQGLRPPILDDLGLAPALRRLLADLASGSSIDTKLLVDGRSGRLPADAELALFRIAQEALHNVDRHSGASRVRVRLDYGPRKTKLEIADDGTGFSLPAALNDLASENRLGLLGMQERARILGGNLVINSAPGSGTEIVAEVPSGISVDVHSGRAA